MEQAAGVVRPLYLANREDEASSHLFSSLLETVAANLAPSSE